MKRLTSLPKHRFALIVLLGLVAIATPWSEVWRRQAAELRTAIDARRALEPVALAAQAQRAIAAHRPYAAAVLAGRSEQEAERLRRQHAVDTEVGGLVASLESQRLHRALDETDQLRNEWSSLLEGIGRRQLRTPASNLAHDLLVDQAFVVMDLAAGAGGLHGQVGRGFDATELEFALRTLPRYGNALAAWRGEVGTMGDADAAAQHVHVHVQAEAKRAARAAATLLAAADSTGRAPDPAWEHALVALQHSASQLAGLLARGGPAAAEPGVPQRAQLAARAEIAALEALTSQVARLDAGLVDIIAVVESERRLVAAVGLLALLVGTLAAALALPREGEAEAKSGAAEPVDSSLTAPRSTADTVATGAESEGPTSDLLQRLRRRGAEAAPGEPLHQRPPAPR